MIPLLLFDLSKKKSIIIGCLIPHFGYMMDRQLWFHTLPESYFPKAPPLELIEVINFYGSCCVTLIFVFIFVKNISSLSESLEKRRDIESRDLKEAQKLGKIGNWSFDLSSGVIKWSDQMYSIFPENKKEGEPTFERHRSTIHPDDVERWETVINSCMENGEPYSMTFRTYREREGEREDVWVEALGRVSLDSKGEISQLFGTCQDITTQKKTHEKHLNEINDILSSTPSCLKIITKDGSLIHMNSQGLDLIEVESLDSARQRNLYEFIETSHRDQFIEFNKRICRGSKESLRFEIVGLKGTRRWMETYAAPYVLQNGEI